MKKTLAVIFVFLATSTAFPQQEPTAEVELGRTMQEVVQVFGPPQECYVRDIGKHRFTPTECRAAQEVYHDVRDVYTRKTTTNEFELRMHYGIDSSKSRLHPDLRLESVELVIDRPKPFAEIASDLPEARKMCAGGCFMLGTNSERSGIDGPLLVLYPKKPAKLDQAEAEKVANGFKDSAGGADEEDWVFAIRLGWTAARDSAVSLDGEVAVVSRGPAAIDWLKHPIEKVEITVVSPSFLKSLTEQTYGPTPAVVELGEYKP